MMSLIDVLLLYQPVFYLETFLYVNVEFFLAHVFFFNPSRSSYVEIICVNTQFEVKYFFRTPLYLHIFTETPKDFCRWNVVRDMMPSKD